MIVRAARPEDMEAITAIYAHHVAHGAGSFEEAAPDLAEMRRRHEAVLAAGLPYLAAEDGGEVAGYAYAVQFRPRPAYRFAVEDSVYVGPGREGRGVGRALLTTLVDRCTALGLRRMVSVIGDSGNAASIALHRACGFEPCAVMPAMGWKFGRWLDLVVMQRALGEGSDTAPQ